MAESNWKNRTLFHGDNLPFLRAMNSESVDLIATDPPFNKGKDFHATPDSLAAGARFQDRWSWEKDVHEEWVDKITDDYPRLMEAIESARYAHSDGMGAFMCFMAVRLLEMRRVLKTTGSLYLHCDPTASHYLKAVMDAIFGWKNFRNEIIWKRSANPKGSQHEMARFSPFTDTILYYARSHESKINVNTIRIPLTLEELAKKYPYKDEHGRYADGPILRSESMGPRPNLVYSYKGFTPGPAGWRVNRETLEDIDKKGNLAWTKTGRVRRKLRPSDIEKGKPIGSLWDDIAPINSQAKERLGYPTQKPLALYERIIRASSDPGDLVLDPFCGCATACVAAERLKRRWIGIDIWDNAQAVVLQRLEREGLVGEDSDGLHGHLFAEDVHFTANLPARTDDGEEAAPFLRVKERVKEPNGKQMSRAEMYDFLLTQHGPKCQGCDRMFDDPRYLELDHNTPRSDGGLNHISNRILLCGPCNRAKSNQYTLSGLHRINKKNGWMVKG